MSLCIRFLLQESFQFFLFKSFFSGVSVSILDFPLTLLLLVCLHPSALGYGPIIYGINELFDVTGSVLSCTSECNASPLSVVTAIAGGFSPTTVFGSGQSVTYADSKSFSEKVDRQNGQLQVLVNADQIFFDENVPKYNVIIKASFNWLFTRITKHPIIKNNF